MSEQGKGDSLENWDDRDSVFEAILSGIDVSRRLGRKYSLFPRSIEALIDLTVEGLSGDGPYQINFHPRNYRSRVFLGTIEVSERHADIYYDRDQNECWRRFITAKELSHLLFALPGEKHCASTPEEIEQLMVSVLAGFDPASLANHAISTEYSTMLMALEILLPHSEREKLPGLTDLEVATQYRIPEAMVKAYRSEGYRKLMDKGYAMADRVKSPPRNDQRRA